MTTIGDADSGTVLAMEGRRSPWGGGGNDGGDGEPPRKGEDPSEGEGEADKPGSGGSSGEGSGGGSGGGKDHPEGPRNPWLPSGETPPRRSARIEDIFRASGPRRPSGSGGPGGLPPFPRRSDGKSWLPLGIGIAVVALVGLSSVHMLGPKEQGVVTRLGQYDRTIDSGVSLTLPWPIEQVEVKDVRSFTVDTIPDGEGEKLMLTSDKNLVDLSYLVRWNIKNLTDYTYRLDDPDGTVREVAEAAMRASIGQVSLNDALSGAGRAKVEEDVRSRIQRILDGYHAGVAIQGVEIKKADPPSKTRAAFDQVNVAQQEADRDRSNARAIAQQVLARAQGDATAFDKVYEQYKLAPDVTRQRMYYETMERVISENDTVVAEPKNMTGFLPLPEMKRRIDAASQDITVTAPTGTATSSTQGGQ